MSGHFVVGTIRTLAVGMVSWPALLLAEVGTADSGTAAAGTANKAEPWLLRLDPVSRTKVLMALAALLLLGGLLVAIVVLWGRHVRRKIREPLPGSRMHDDDWYNKPLVPKPRDEDVDEPESGGRVGRIAVGHREDVPAGSGQRRGPDARMTGGPQRQRG